VKIIKREEKKRRKKGGRLRKITVEKMVMMMFEYYRQYRTYYQIGDSYGISESNTYRIIKYVEETLIRSEEFKLEGKKGLFLDGKGIDICVVDATESVIERPKKQRKGTSGKKKKHTIKTLLVVELKTKQIICTAIGNGRKHDFKLFKEARIYARSTIRYMADTGFMGLNKIHANTLILKKEIKETPAYKRR
jgi:hypothetical protein